MRFDFLLLFCGLSFINVVIQTVKSLCTIKCKTFVSACINALAYGIYTYVIIFTNSEGLPIWGKALITALANFSGVYMANALFNKLFTKEVLWKIEISLPALDAPEFIERLNKNGLKWLQCGFNDEYISYTVFCPTKKDSHNLRLIMPDSARYNISEHVKRLSRRFSFYDHLDVIHPNLDVIHPFPSLPSSIFFHPLSTI